MARRGLAAEWRNYEWKSNDKRLKRLKWREWDTRAGGETDNVTAGECRIPIRGILTPSLMTLAPLKLSCSVAQCNFWGWESTWVGSEWICMCKIIQHMTDGQLNECSGTLFIIRGILWEKVYIVPDCKFLFFGQKFHNQRIQVNRDLKNGYVQPGLKITISHKL